MREEDFKRLLYSIEYELNNKQIKEVVTLIIDFLIEGQEMG